MTKNILALLGLMFMIGLITTSQSQAGQAGLKNDKIFLSHCSNFGDDLSFGFTSCLNRNFQTVGTEIDAQIYLSHCSNYGDGVSYGFEACLNRNFSKIERVLKSSYLSRCSNYSRDRVDYSFVSCINSNFSAIQRSLSRR